MVFVTLFGKADTAVRAPIPFDIRFQIFDWEKCGCADGKKSVLTFVLSSMKRKMRRAQIAAAGGVRTGQAVKR
jgi:hypothetical protein